MWITYIINNHSTIWFSCGSLLRLGTSDTMAVVDHFSARNSPEWTKGEVAGLDPRKTGLKNTNTNFTTKKRAPIFWKKSSGMESWASPLGLKVWRKFNPKCVEEKHTCVGNTSKSQPKIKKKHVQRQPTNTTITSSPKPTTPVLIWETQTCRFWSEGGSPVVGWVHS